MKNDPSSAVGFPDFLEDNWQINGCVPLRIDCSSGTIATCPVFPKKQSIICFLREQLLLDISHLETPIQSTFV